MFLILLIASLIALVALIIASFYVLTSPSSDWVSDMWSYMGGMMGTSGVTIQNPAAPYFMVMVVVLVGVVIASAGGLVYFFMFPEIKTACQAKSAEQVATQNSAMAYEAIVKTLTDEEREVIQVLTAHNGKYLQKYIRKEAGLSRLKTHRILVRLADRGIVTLKKTGNTNEVQLSEWLNK
jgi:uncharacterized membrane protein